MPDDSTLEDLDGERWGEPDADATSLIIECHRLRKIPVRSLSNDELRLLLGQHIGAEWLVPVALNRLHEEPLAGDPYPGDLLNAVLGTDSRHWAMHPDDAVSLWAVRATLEQVGTAIANLLERKEWPAVRWAVSSEQRNIHDEQSEQD